MRWIFAAILSIATLGSAIAADLGVHGKVWRVTDVDFRLFALHKASLVDWEAEMEQNKKNVENQLKNMPKYIQQRPAEELTVYKPVMETIVQRDITAPVVRADGTIEYVYIARAGDRLNAFETMHTEEKFFFFNPDIEEQMDFVLALHHNGFLQKHFITPIATGGNMLENFKLFDGSLKYAYQDVVLDFGVKREYTLVFHKQGEANIRVVEFPEEITPEMINEVLID